MSPCGSGTPATGSRRPQILLAGRFLLQPAEKMTAPVRSVEFPVRRVRLNFGWMDETARSSPLALDKEHPFKNLGIRTVSFNGASQPGTEPLSIQDVELTAREFRGINGVQQLLRNPLV